MTEELEQGRRLYAERAWLDAHEALSRADEAAALGAEDLELLATAAYMLGRDEEQLTALERAHGAHLDDGECLRAARCAFWVGMHLSIAGDQVGRASGWIGRAQRLVEREGRECALQGYLLLPLAFRREAAGELEAAAATAAEAAAYGERFGDPDLFGLAVHMQGQLLVVQGRVPEGLGLLDEAMVAVTAGEMSPIVSGFVYCGVIMGCQDAFEIRRAQEWTAALSRWCEEQRDMVAFTGTCMVHRAELLHLNGAWGKALEEARMAGKRCLDANNTRVNGEALYLQGELHRLRGDFDRAEEAFREASRCGCEPQPGLALLRLAQGDAAAGAAAIRRVLAETTDRPGRARLLPAAVEILLAAGEADEAREAARELGGLALGFEGGLLEAAATYARGAVELAGGDARSALLSLRRAWHVWQEIGAPYEAARTRVLLARTCGELGDGDAAALELDAAREAFEELGAGPDLARVAEADPAAAPGEAHGLSPREIEVLRLLSGGATNRAIAERLVLSKRTVDRHVSNIFAKLRVSSRAAATAYAYEHELV